MKSPSSHIQLILICNQYVVTIATSGKLAATLYRPYKFNTKGRDWYDFLWYISRKTVLNLEHFRARIVQIEKWPAEKPLTRSDLMKLILDRIEALNLNDAKSDVLPFVKDQYAVEQWTKDLFIEAVNRLNT